jgi:hypothetical protein
MTLYDFPLPFQSSWLNKAIIKNTKKTPYTSDIVKKNVISSLNVTPILRISKFLKKTSTNALTCVFSDSTHQILVLLPFKPTIVAFENLYKQRITFHTVNCLVEIKQANLRFISRQTLANDFEININNKVDIIILEVLDLRIFQRDQVFLSGHVENRLKFVYFDPKYVEVCGNFDKNEGSRKREKRIEGTRRRRGIRREEKASTARVPKENA